MQTTKKTKVAVPGTRTVQPPPKWEMKCDWVTDMIPQCRVRRSSLQHVLHFCFFQIEYQPEEYTVPVRKCEQGQAEKCFKYEVPKWKVVRNLVVKLIQRMNLMDISLSRPSSR